MEGISSDKILLSDSHQTYLRSLKEFYDTNTMLVNNNCTHFSFYFSFFTTHDVVAQEVGNGIVFYG